MISLKFEILNSQTHKDEQRLLPGGKDEALEMCWSMDIKFQVDKRKRSKDIVFSIINVVNSHVLYI